MVGEWGGGEWGSGGWGSSSGADGFSPPCPRQKLKETVERPILWSKRERTGVEAV